MATAIDELPRSIDINPTASCNLDCTFCWGPDHAIRDALDTDDWIELITFFRRHGTTSIVFTGGEPLLRPDIGVLLRTAADLGYRVTLSTNALLLPRRLTDILGSINEIGLPLDGPTARSNAAMRLGRLGFKAFDAALTGMRLVGEHDPAVQITVRTVVSRVNLAWIPSIAEVLRGQPSHWHRWKLYQFVPASIGERHQYEHQVDRTGFARAVGNARLRLGNRHVIGQSADDRTGRYLFVGPRGDIFTSPAGTGYRVVGSWHDLRRGIGFADIASALDHSRNAVHGMTNHVPVPRIR